MDSHAKRLRTLARAAHRCGIGDMLHVTPGSIQESASGQLQLPGHEHHPAANGGSQHIKTNNNEAVFREGQGGSHSWPDEAQSREDALWQDSNGPNGVFDTADFDMESLNPASAAGLSFTMFLQ